MQRTPVPPYGSLGKNFKIVLYFNHKLVKGVGVMTKVKFLTKGDCIFLIILLAYMIFSYYVSEFSILWFSFQYIVSSGYYFLFIKDYFFKPLSPRKRFIVSFIALFFMMSIINPRVYVSNDNTLVYRSSEYVQATRHFVQLDNSTLQNEMDTQKKQIRFVYVGRETCPYCREFAPKLRKAARSINATVYYIDTENKTDELAKFAEQYHIDSIPTLLVFKDGQLQETLTNSSDISLNDLKEFFKSHK